MIYWAIKQYIKTLMIQEKIRRKSILGGYGATPEMVKRVLSEKW
jgi:hypothetical protein